MAFYDKDISSIDKLIKYKPKVQALCTKYKELNFTEKDINRLDDCLKRTYFDKEFYNLLNKHDLNKNKEQFLNFIKDLKDIREDEENDYNEYAIETYIFLNFTEKDLETKIAYYISLFLNKYLSVQIIDLDQNVNLDAYELIFNEEERHNLRVITSIVEYRPYTIAYLFKYINQSDKEEIINKYYKLIYNVAYSRLNNDEKEILKRKLKENNIYLKYDRDIYESPIEEIMVKHGSDLLKKLKAKYKKLYKNSSFDDIIFIQLALGDIKILKDIYTNSYYGIKDISVLKVLLNYFEDNNIGNKIIKTAKLRERMGLINNKLYVIEKDLFNKITGAKDDNELKILLEKYKITKENFFNIIIERRHLDKKQKQAILERLAKYYKTSYLSLFTILSYIQEAKEKALSITDVLKDHQVNPYYYKETLKKLKNEKPEIYEIIKMSENESYKLSKKTMKLYSSFIESNITNYDSFVKMFNLTPEELLALFEETYLYDSVYEKLLEWYDFAERKLDDKQANPAHKYKR